MHWKKKVEVQLTCISERFILFYVKYENAGSFAIITYSRYRGVAALLETGDSVPRTFLTHRQYFHPHSLICYLDLSELTFSQSQGESSLGCVCHELQISRCSRRFIHSLLCSLAVWGKMHPRKKQRTITYFFFSNTHTL